MPALSITCWVPSLLDRCYVVLELKNPVFLPCVQCLSNMSPSDVVLGSSSPAMDKCGLISDAENSICFPMRYIVLMVDPFIALFNFSYVFDQKRQHPFPLPFQYVLRHVLSIVLFACFCHVAHLMRPSYSNRITLFLCENLYLLWWAVHAMSLFICLWVLLMRISDFTIPFLSEELHNSNWNQVFPNI